MVVAAGGTACCLWIWVSGLGVVLQCVFVLRPCGVVARCRGVPLCRVGIAMRFVMGGGLGWLARVCAFVGQWQMVSSLRGGGCVGGKAFFASPGLVVLPGLR